MGDKNLKKGRGVVGGFFPLPKQVFFFSSFILNQFYMELLTTATVTFPGISAVPGAARLARSDPAGPQKQRPGGLCAAPRGPRAGYSGREPPSSILSFRRLRAPGHPTRGTTFRGADEKERRLLPLLMTRK